MNKDDIKDVKQSPGIYCIKNNIDSKCYIGQSINVKKRLQHHLNRCQQDRYDNLIYRAFKKYGIENFSVSVLEYVDTKDFTYAKKKLDQLEMKYINEYNSYTPNGYNQTIGGDGGILGYKFTDSQRKHVSENSKHAMEDKMKAVYMYNIVDHYYQTWMNCDYAAKMIGVTRSTVHRACDGIIKIIKRKWVASFNKEDLEVKKSYKTKLVYYGKFVYKDSVYTGTIKDAAKAFGLQKSYLYGIVNGSRKSNVLSFTPVKQNIQI